jgi:hypothetical protein
MQVYLPQLPRLWAEVLPLVGQNDLEPSLASGESKARSRP